MAMRDAVVAKRFVRRFQEKSGSRVGGTSDTIAPQIHWTAGKRGYSWNSARQPL